MANKSFSFFLKFVVRLGLEAILQTQPLSQGPEEFCVNKWTTYVKSHLEKCLYLSLSTIN